MRQGDYDFQIDAMEPGDRDGEEIQMMTPEEEAKYESELLFWVQGIGGIKKIGDENADLSVYVKKEGCEDCIKELIKLLKYESSTIPFVRQTLGKWNTLKNDLLPLFMFHTQDKKLSFYTLMLFV